MVYEQLRTLDYEQIRTKMTISIKPTESELEILQILWSRGECTVRTVHEELIKSKDVGYTSTLKLMQIMHEKGLVSRNTESKTHIYIAAINQQDTQKHLLNKLIDNAYNGSAARLVMQALGNHKATSQELEQIKKYLEQLESK
ncbi:BlaI/MecI/CopY family transcriptional regulator [Pedobacter flavus]|uniref:BlaI/MecI/CopY family transcriptional regulator n=1 Tax=Pedobacter flavus TaxID=3113906 RepID=A0ABU7GXK1_9SPHI|nr:BlaI/MecI/CopY family transcriptional regulator [Pedobacter sp. VNH31]MEE1883790.1 BlaI/MecI/CopY family transcriptional regulator [Pedobacter sp. VNH31]